MMSATHESEADGLEACDEIEMTSDVGLQITRHSDFHGFFEGVCDVISLERHAQSVTIALACHSRKHGELMLDVELDTDVVGLPAGIDAEAVLAVAYAHQDTFNGISEWIAIRDAGEQLLLGGVRAMTPSPWVDDFGGFVSLFHPLDPTVVEDDCFPYEGTCEFLVAGLLNLEHEGIEKTIAPFETDKIGEYMVRAGPIAIAQPEHNWCDGGTNQIVTFAFTSEIGEP